MRISMTLDPDVAAKAKLGTSKLSKPFKVIINTALRIGLNHMLAPSTARPYRTQPRPMGLRQGFNYDKVADLLARAEGADHR